MKRHSGIMLAMLVLLPVGAGAQQAAPAPRPARAPEARRWAPRPNCTMLLLRAHLARLKTRLGMSDAQLSQLETLRTPFLAAAVKLRAEMEQLHLKLAEQLSADLPNETAVIDLERKLRTVYGQLEEDGTRTYLKLLGVLTQPQRAALRQQCSPMGPPHRRMKRWAGPGPR